MPFETEQYTYQKVAEDLKQRITSSQFANNRLPSERELAREYSLNRMTIRKSLDILEKEEKIFKLGPRGTFIGKEPLDAIGPKQKTIGFVLANREIFDEHHSKMLLELESKTKDRGDKMMFFTINSEKDIDNLLVSIRDKHSPDGIVISGLLTAEILKSLKQAHISVVVSGYLLYPDPIENEFNRVLVDSIGYGRCATEYLIKLGHRKIVLINGPSHQRFLNIHYGYMKAITDAGIEYNENLVLRCEKDALVDGYTVAHTIIDTIRPTAIVAANDRLALGALNACVEKGLKVPGDVSIIGIGDFDGGRISNPPLTTIGIDREALAESALDLLYGMLRNGQRSLPQTRFAPFRLIERQSCKGV